MYSTTFNNYRDAAQVNTAMGRVYGHMALAVITSMVVSMFVGMNPELVQFFFTGILKWVVIFAPLAATLPFAVTGSFTFENINLEYR